MSESEMYEKAKQSILSDSTLSQIQKEKLLCELDRKITIARPSERKQLDIKIEADSGVLRELATENAELRKKVEQTDVEIANAVREKLRLKFLDNGLDAPRLETKEDMDNATQILKELQNRKPRESPSGSAPLEGQYASMQGSGNQQGFETREAMIDALRFQEKFGETDEIKKDATNILNQIFRKWVSAKKSDSSLQDKIPESELETPNEYRKRTRKKRER